jgi:hypothetical protein
MMCCTTSEPTERGASRSPSGIRGKSQLSLRCDLAARESQSDRMSLADSIANFGRECLFSDRGEFSEATLLEGVLSFFFSPTSHP